MDNQPLLWTGPRREVSLSVVPLSSARRVAGQRTSSVIPQRNSPVNRGNAYILLAAKLNELRAMGYDSLRPRVGQPAVSETIQVGGEPVVLDLKVDWADQKRGKLQVCGTAFGPSTWMTERLEESFVIGPSSPAAG